LKFEVLRNRDVLANTEHQVCIPDKETLKNMKSAGLSFRFDGKAYNPFLRENQKGTKEK
jgi:hypothetical protein